MKMRSWTKMAVACVALVLLTGCDLELMLTQPDAVQGVIRQYLDLFSTAFLDWTAFATELPTILPF